MKPAACASVSTQPHNPCLISVSTFVLFFLSVYSPSYLPLFSLCCAFPLIYIRVSLFPLPFYFVLSFSFIFTLHTSFAPRLFVFPFLSYCLFFPFSILSRTQVPSLTVLLFAFIFFPSPFVHSTFLFFLFYSTCQYLPNDPLVQLVFF
jgi:hypothetical protein